MVPDPLASKRAALVSEAAHWLGVHESGTNAGPEVEMFQRVLGNAAEGQSWCMDFVHFCAKRVDAKLGSPPSCLYPSQGVLAVWNKTTVHARRQGLEVAPGDLMVWQHYDRNNMPTALGHIGIVTKILGPGKFETIEGNTSAGFGVEREGEGVYRKVRDVGGSSMMRVKGFLRVWNPG